MRELYSKHLLTKDELYGPFAFYLKKNGQWLCEAETTSMKVLDLYHDSLATNKEHDIKAVLEMMDKSPAPKRKKRPLREQN